MKASKKQKSLKSFFQSSSSSKTAPSPKRRRSQEGSCFGECPICSSNVPLHTLERHASDCRGGGTDENHNRLSGKHDETASHVLEPIPGLFLFEDFITEDDEAKIIAELDGTDMVYASEFLPWKAATFNGAHYGKRWGVHCNLRDRRVGEAENPLPHFVQQIVLPKLAHLPAMKGCVPNEANAIEYRKAERHYLTAHVDDRKLSKEPIANLSLAGDCYMTFRNVAPHRTTAVPLQRVLLRRRCLQVLTGKARYDFSHEINPDDVLSSRRISVTMRESPLTQQPHQQQQAVMQWWKQDPDAVVSTSSKLVPTNQPLPGLYLFEDFVTDEEEAVILAELDGSRQSWKPERHTGVHREKRFGVDHDLWNRQIRAPKQGLPKVFHSIILPKLLRVSAMMGCIPNDANALDYRRQNGDYLKAHVDDRAKHKEPIANLSLAGDCFMTYRNQEPKRNLAALEKKVLLKRRCLQVLTGKARYEFSHAIENNDLLSDRRVSITMRETPWG